MAFLSQMVDQGREWPREVTRAVSDALVDGIVASSDDEALLVGRRW